MGRKDNQKQIDVQLLEQEYESLAPRAQNFSHELVNQLVRLLNEAGITLGFPIQHRVKTWSSLSEKFERIQFRISSIKEIQDLVGLRVILLFRRDVDTVAKLIGEHFNIVRQYDTQDRLKEDQFGYSSKHFIVQVPDTWLTVPTLTKMGGFQAEIQIRTLAQHTWAEASHVLQYKQEESVPPSIRRTIHRVSALLETIDLEFERVLKEKESYRTDINVADSEERLNVDILEKTLDTLLPKVNKTENELYSEAIQELTALGIATQGQLRELITNNLESALTVEAIRLKWAQDRLTQGKSDIGTTLERTLAGVFLTHIGLLRQILQHAFGEEYYISLEAQQTQSVRKIDVNPIRRIAQNHAD